MVESPNVTLNTLREKCPNTEFFLVRISSIWAEYGLEKTPYLVTFHAVIVDYDLNNFSLFNLIHKNENMSQFCKLKALLPTAIIYKQFPRLLQGSSW